MAKQWVGIVEGRFMTSFFVYLHSLSHSVMLKRERKKTLSQSQQPTFQPPDPPHTLIQEPLNPINPLHICLWVRILLKLLQSLDKYGLIYKCMLGLSRFRQLYSKQLLPGKTLPFRENNSSVALLRNRLEGPGEVSLTAHRPTLAHTHESQTREGEYTLESKIRLLGRLLIKLRLSWLGIKLNIEPRSNIEQRYRHTENRNRLSAEWKSQVWLLEVCSPIWRHASIIHVVKDGHPIWEITF